MEKLKKIVRQFGWNDLKKDFKNYNLNSFGSDFSAGLLVAAVGFPSLMAFAMLAGLSPVYGLYSFIVAAIVGTFVGISKYMVLGPTNVIALMIANTFGSLAITGSAKLEVVFLLTLMVGVIQIVLSFLDFGEVSNYISRSVISGLMTGIGVIIAVGQLVRVLGLEAAKNGSVFNSLQRIFTNVQRFNFHTLLVALITFSVILIVKSFSQKAPSYLIGVVVSAIIVYFAGLESQVALVEPVEASFPGFNLPTVDFELMMNLSSYAFAIAMLGFLDVLIVTEFNEKGAIESDQANKELAGMGLVNVACSFFNGFAGGGSFSRSFANYEGGAKSRFSQLIAGIFVLLFLIFFSELIAFLPVASLGAVLIFVAVRMINLKEIKEILTAKRFDAWIFIATFLATLFFPRLDHAVYIGVLFSLLLVLRDTSNLNYTYLKIDEKEINQKDLDEMRDQEEIIIDLSGTLHFNTVDKIKKQLEEALEIGDSFIIRMRNVEDVDLTTLSELEEFIDKVRKKGGDVYFAGLSEEMKKDFERCGLGDKLGEKNYFSKNKKLFSSSKTALKEAKNNRTKD